MGGRSTFYIEVSILRKCLRSSLLEADPEAAADPRKCSKQKAGRKGKGEAGQEKKKPGKAQVSFLIKPDTHPETVGRVYLMSKGAPVPKVKVLAVSNNPWKSWRMRKQRDTGGSGWGPNRVL